MQRGTTEMDREVPVKLTEHEVAERAEIMSAKLLRVKALKRQRREAHRNLTAQIEAELEEANRIARVVAEGIEARKQSELKYGDEVVPSASEATAALAELEKRSQERAPEYHKNGELCKRDVCKRRHLTLEQARAAGIKVEGDPITPEGAEGEGKPTLAVGSPCPGCDKNLETATEALKGLCESCQTSKGGDPLEGTPQAAPAPPAEGETNPAEGETETPSGETNEASGETTSADDDPRPRCSAGGEVLNADEVAKGLGLCQACIDAAGGDDTAPATKPEPDTPETPALGGEAGA